MSQHTIGLIGRKVGMTQVFQDDGTMVAVSVLAIEPNTVTRLRTTDRDGYTAVQLGTEPGRKKLTKPEAGQLKDLPKAAQNLKTVREFRHASNDLDLNATPAAATANPAAVTTPPAAADTSPTTESDSAGS